LFLVFIPKSVFIRVDLRLKNMALPFLAGKKTMNYFFATDYTDFHRFSYSNPRKSVKHRTGARRQCSWLWFWLSR